MPTTGPIPFIKTFTTGDKRRESEPVAPDLTQKLPQRRRASIAGNDFSGFHIPKNLKKLLADATEFETLAELEEATIQKEKEESLPVILNLEDDPYYGEELYLSDSVQNVKKPEKAEKILQRKKLELQQRRQQKKQFEEEQAKRLEKIMMRQKPNSFTDIEPQTQTHYSLNMPEKCPTFEEFLKILKEDEYVDPRFRNKEQRKSKRIRKKYNLGKDAFRSKQVISSVTVEASPSRSSRRGSMGPGSRGLVTLPTLHEKFPGSFDRMRFAEEVHGVTDSEPCKEHCLKTLPTAENGREKMERTKSRKSVVELAKAKGKRLAHLQPDIVVLSPSGNNQEVVFKSPTSSGSSSSPMFPRISLGEDVRETPDANIYDESDDDEDDTSSFDSTKLNLKYR